MLNNMTKSQDGQGLSSVGRALLMVEAVARNGNLNVTQLARQLETGKATAFRVAHTLVDHGWLVKDADRHYRLGPVLSALAQGAATTDLRADLIPVMEQLREKTGETIHLTKLEGRKIIYIEQLVSTRPVLSVATIGDSSPAHCVSPGLAQLAALDAVRLDRFLSKPLEQFTEASITDPNQLRLELARVRERGYAINIGGYRSDVGGVACALFDGRGTLLGGISICVPVYRLDSARITELGAQAMKAAHEAMKKIRYH
jgi:DNA-binding IclR family transcriptional regulator